MGAARPSDTVRCCAVPDTMPWDAAPSTRACRGCAGYAAHEPTGEACAASYLRCAPNERARARARVCLSVCA